MTILDDIISLLNSSRPLRLDDPIIITLARDHRIKFTMVMRLLATQPADEIIQWVAEQSALYESLLAPDTASGVHLRLRLDELQALARTAGRPAPAPAPAPATEVTAPPASANANTQDPQAEIRKE